MSIESEFRHISMPGNIEEVASLTILVAELKKVGMESLQLVWHNFMALVRLLMHATPISISAKPSFPTKDRVNAKLKIKR